MLQEPRCTSISGKRTEFSLRLEASLRNRAQALKLEFDKADRSRDILATSSCSRYCSHTSRRLRRKFNQPKSARRRHQIAKASASLQKATQNPRSTRCRANRSEGLTQGA